MTFYIDVQGTWDILSTGDQHALRGNLPWMMVLWSSCPTDPSVVEKDLSRLKPGDVVIDDDQMILVAAARAGASTLTVPHGLKLLTELLRGLE